MTQKSDAEVRSDFKRAVNMDSTELRRWLATRESQSVGWTYTNGSVG
jgi:hypothetical protein